MERTYGKLPKHLKRIQHLLCSEHAKPYVNTLQKIRDRGVENMLNSSILIKELRDGKNESGFSSRHKNCFLTASSFPSFLGISPYISLYDYLNERINKIEKTSDYQKMIMEHGVDSEKEAISELPTILKQWKEEEEFDFTQVSFYIIPTLKYNDSKVPILEEMSYLCSTPDGISENYILELKCPYSKVYDCMITKENRHPPLHHHLQVLFQLYVDQEYTGKTRKGIYIVRYASSTPRHLTDFQIVKGEAIYRVDQTTSVDYYSTVVSPNNSLVIELIKSQINFLLDLVDYSDLSKEKPKMYKDVQTFRGFKKELEKTLKY